MRTAKQCGPCQTVQRAESDMDLGLIFARLFRFQDYLRHPQKNNKLRSNCKSNTPNLPYNIILEKTMSNKELFDNYKDYLANNDYLGANTKYAYICDVKFYMTFLEGMDVSKAEPGTDSSYEIYRQGECKHPSHDCVCEEFLQISETGENS